MQIPLQLVQSLTSTSTYMNKNVKYYRGQKLQHKVSSFPRVLGTIGQVMLCLIFSEYHDDKKTENFMWQTKIITSMTLIK